MSPEENAGGVEIAAATCVFSERMPASIAKALVAAQRAVEPVGKTAENKFAHYMYAPMDVLSGECRRALTSAGLALVVTGAEPIEAHGERRLAVSAMLVHDSGDSWDLPGYSIPVVIGTSKAGNATPADKAEAAALTYARGYLAMCLLQIAREDADSVDQRGEPAPRNDGAPGKLSECATPAQLLAWCSSRAAQIKSANEERRAEAHAGIVEAARRVGGDASAALAKAGLP